MSRTKQGAVVIALVFSSASAEGNAIAKKPAARRIRWSEYLETIARDADESRFGRPS
jgi:hypothetical protein